MMGMLHFLSTPMVGSMLSALQLTGHTVQFV